MSAPHNTVIPVSLLYRPILLAIPEEMGFSEVSATAYAMLISLEYADFEWCTVIFAHNTCKLCHGHYLEHTEVETAFSIGQEGNVLSMRVLSCTL